jgi:hypothetical protein
MKVYFTVNGSGIWDERKVWRIRRIGACRVLVGHPEGKRPLGRPGPRW